MRHQQIYQRDSFDIVDVAAIWPLGSAPAAPLAEIEIGMARGPAAPVPDLPRAAGSYLLAAYGSLMGAFVVTMAADGPSTFAIAISIFYVAMFLAVPAAFLKIAHRSGSQPSLGAFLDKGMDTATGHVGGASALTQMLIVPALLTVAILAIGTAARIML